MPTPRPKEEEQIREEFKGILEDFYQNLPESRRKFMTDKRLQEFDITVQRRKKPEGWTPDDDVSETNLGC
jgi:pSer/pThr/pTyr-binding forkhead associated (FHA) protein